MNKVNASIGDLQYNAIVTGLPMLMMDSLAPMMGDALGGADDDESRRLSDHIRGLNNVRERVIKESAARIEEERGKAAELEMQRKHLGEMKAKFDALKKAESESPYGRAKAFFSKAMTPYKPPPTRTHGFSFEWGEEGGRGIVGRPAGQTLEGSFSAELKSIFVSKRSFESSRRDLHNAHLCTDLRIFFKCFN